MARRSRPPSGRPVTQVVGDPLALRPPPVGSELAVVERAVARTIAQMESEGGRPLGMVRALHDDGWEDMLFIHGPYVMLGLTFDAAGYARSIYLTDWGRDRGAEVSEPVPETELAVFERVLVRCAKESERRDRQELGIRYVRLPSIEGLEAHNPEVGTSACFAFDKNGTLWGLWHNLDARNEAWLAHRIPRLNKERRT